MNRYRVAIAMRSRSLPHVDTTASYHVEAKSHVGAIGSALAAAKREGMPTEAARRITVSLARTVAP